MYPQRQISVFAPAPVPAPPGENLPAPGAYDLVDMPTLKDELSIPGSDTSSDSFLARAITDISARISKYCGSASEIGGRVFQVEGLTELIYIDQDPYPYQTPGGLDPLQLTRWPMVNLTTLFASAPSPTGGTVLTFATVPATVLAGQPASHANMIPGTTVVSTTPTTVTISQPLILPVNIGDAVLFGLSVAQTIASGDLVSLGPGLNYTYLADEGALLRLNQFTGVMTLWEAIPTTVSYYAGYPSIPADLAGAALEWLTMRFFQRGRDPMLRSQEQPGLGTQAWWVGGPPNSGSVPDSIRGILDGYRERVIA